MASTEILIATEATAPDLFLENLGSLFSQFVPCYLWLYNEPMEIRSFDKSLGASGKCPHCRVVSLFVPVSLFHTEVRHDGNRVFQYGTNAAKCQNCGDFILVVGLRLLNSGTSYKLADVYPIGQPDENIDESVPEDVAEDFKEAIRCRWIKSYKACVLMCRRAIQCSVIALQAQGNTLKAQIDDLFKRGVITEPLKDFAHAIRLTGNVGAHPDELQGLHEKDASDMVAFVHQYLQHVYIMPAKLKARTVALKAT